MLRENGSYRSSSQPRNVKSFSEVPEVESTSAWQSASSAVDTRSSAWRSSRSISSVIGFTSNTTRQQNAGGHNFMAYIGVPHIGQIIPQAGYFAPEPYMPYPNIKFTVNHTLGIRLVDAMNPAFDGLDDADFCPQILENMMTKIMLRIKWPGYPAWNEVIHVFDHNYNVIPNTYKKVSQLVAQKIQSFCYGMRDHPYNADSGVDGWQLHRYPFENLVLLELQHVGRGSWQPVISAI
ncbi:hypothetical protein BC629DRAFT_1512515 [Irpex lacteus]|nr:hypothetical protein BC629DRAFT_1512515 [Irpex lacteus]